MTTITTATTKICIEQAATELELLLEGYSWFIATEVAPNKTITVYVENMSADVSDTVPDIFYGYQCTLGYGAYMDCGKKYGVIHLELVNNNLLEETIRELDGLN